ncbi:CPBP family intramembrane metalloprotease [Brevundimonas diminuta]|jgi:membrane protease YdiL (CAAX protease family)|uniref:CPBP family intramembrane metalloprotease n=1 Tax=Brevundimonas diminuta TaxID=293 RepID=A0A410NUS4_BREDI|nr:CPBP family intramembrane glutamic endopeptidase [Brevundimonas diminuta]MBD3572004.1 CPBP family intramembrane metalloprotease [Brevundimonas diminuta]MBI2249133.1 CPBP family intramembrane metalloprotease [Brevundimonas diminuta]QAT13622.1 CPBP family intramembrane metalloprotease [Brevundimonas diminuta]QQB89013.1 CPBP family intramembrane metalloprotease [Brevundimonas diminuta]
MIAHRLSPFFALALAALTFWLLVSAPGVVEPEFAGTIYGVFALLVAVVFGLIFIGLHFTTAGSITYWSASSPPDQVGRVGVMIGATLAIHLGLSWFLELLGRANETSAIVGLLCWTLVPATFLALGLVRWPVRLTRASRLRLSLASVAAFGFAIGVSYLKFANAPPDSEILTVGDLVLHGPVLLVAAAAEEVVFRVLLLTALLDLTRSRFHAVFVSSVVFGLGHAPLALIQPVALGDWTLLQHSAQAYAPHLLLQVLGGLALGSVWLRTGSLGLVVVTHAIMNVGPVLPFDF